MRYVVAKEGKDTWGDGQFPTAGCFELSDHKIPVSHNFYAPTVGWAKDFRRDVIDNEIVISCEIDFLDKELEMEIKDLDTSISVTIVKSSRYNDALFVIKAIIREIMFLPKTPYFPLEKKDA